MRIESGTHIPRNKLIKTVNIFRHQTKAASDGQVSAHKRASYFALTKQYNNKVYGNVSISGKFAMQTSVGGVTPQQLKIHPRVLNEEQLKSD